jgi:hypothetical protein
LKATPISATTSKPTTTGYAARAGVGQREDGPRPDEVARNRSRTQAHDWPRADRGLCSKTRDTGNGEDREVVLQVLEHWTQCGDLAGIRDAIALAELSEPERNEWQAIWAEVEALLKRAQGQTPATP